MSPRIQNLWNLAGCRFPIWTELSPSVSRMLREEQPTCLGEPAHQDCFYWLDEKINHVKFVKKAPKNSNKNKNICLEESKAQQTCEPWRTDPKETSRTPSLAESMNCKQSKFWSWASALSSVQESMTTIQYSSWPFAKEAKREPVADQLGALCLVCTASSRSRPGSAAPALRVVSLSLDFCHYCQILLS